MSIAWQHVVPVVRRTVILLLVGLSVPLAVPSRAAEVPPSMTDETGVRATLAQYFKGHATGDPEQMRKAFLPSAHIEGIREGHFVSWTLQQYCALFKGKPAADEATRIRTVDSIDMAGDAAMAKATLVHGAITFTDYFVLLRVEGQWMIANKVYQGQRL